MLVEEGADLESRDVIDAMCHTRGEAFALTSISGKKTDRRVSAHEQRQ